MSIRIFLFALLAIGSALVQAQPPSQAKAQLVLSVKSAPAGSAVKGTVKLTIPAGYHAYQNPASKDYMIPVKVTILTKDCVLKEVVYPAGKEVRVTGEKDPIRVYEDTIEIPIVFLVPKKTGKTVIKVSVSYQLCVDAECYPPDDAAASEKLNVTAVKK